MKIAGAFVGYVGAWLLATVLLGAILAAAYAEPMASGFLEAAPWTGALAIGVATMIAGSDLYDRDGNR